jgi:AcrR family transcriptional regulator
VDASPLPLSRRRALGARTRERILEVTIELMAERGYSGTTISAISKASGVKPASIYWHFENKEGLLAAVVERAADAWFRDAADAMAHAGDSDDVRERNLAAFNYLFQKQPELYRVLLLISLERPDPGAASLAAVKRVRERCKQFIAARLEARIPVPDTEKRRELCQRLAGFGMVLLDGSFVAHQIDSADPEKLVELFEQLIWALSLAREATLEQAVGAANAAEGRRAAAADSP